MPDVFWLGLAIVASAVLLGLIAGVRSRTTGVRTGLALGAFLLAAFPLLAIGLSTA